MTNAERLQVIESALMRAHCLSRAVNFIVTADSDYAGSTFCASIEEVNECAHEAIQEAIGHLEELSRSERTAS